MGKFLYYKNIKIHYSNSGHGLAIVLLHGFLENLNMWEELSEVLRANYNVTSIDLLGHGQTGSLGKIHTMDDMAEAVKTVLDHLKLNRYVLIGHSMGGYVAVAFAEKYHENLIGLCLANSTSRADSKEKRINRDRAIAAVKQNHKSFVRISITNLFRPKNRRLFSDQLKAAKAQALKTSLEGTIAALEGMKRRPDREHIFQKYAFNKLMIVGKKDPVFNYRAIIKEAEKTGAMVVELADGHMSYIENKKEFTYNIMHFIEKL